MIKQKPELPNIIHLAQAIVEEASGESLSDQCLPKEPTRQKNPAAVALGKLGGKKGGMARRDKLTAEQRKASAQKAARTWGNRS